MSAQFKTTSINGVMVQLPVVRETKKGTEVANFTIAINKKNSTTEYVDCRIWGQTKVCQYMYKGRQLQVEGTLKTETYTANDGNTITKQVLVVNKVSLEYKTEEPKSAKADELMQSINETLEAMKSVNVDEIDPMLIDELSYRIQKLGF